MVSRCLLDLWSYSILLGNGCLASTLERACVRLTTALYDNIVCSCGWPLESLSIG